MRVCTYKKTQNPVEKRCINYIALANISCGVISEEISVSKEF